MAQTDVITIEAFPSTNLGESSVLTADANAAQAIVNIENALTYNPNEFVIVGAKGDESAEIKQIQSITGEAITFTTNLANKHFKGEPIQTLRNNQVKLYKAANVDGSVPLDADFSITTTLTLEGDQLFIDYIDTNGGSGFWYKYTFYNSLSAVETPLASATAVRGGNYGHYVTVEEIRTEAGFQYNTDITDEMIADRRDDAESEVRGALYNAGYTLPLAEPIPAIVKNVTKLLAAGYLLLQDYGVLNEGTNKEGEKKLKLAQSILDKIRSREIVLIGDIDSTPQAHTGKVAGWPNASTANASDDEFGGARKATMHDKF